MHPRPKRDPGKDALQIYGAITFSLYGPEKTDWLNKIRHIGVTNDSSGWELETDGTIQPYEETESYSKRRLVDRFTPEMLTLLRSSGYSAL